MELVLVANGTQENKDEAGGNWNLSDVTQDGGFGQPHKGHNLMVEEAHLPNEDVGGF